MAQAAERDGFGAVLRQARAAQAAQLDAVHALSDAKALRLQVLKDELAGVVAASPEVAFELALAPGDTPRLWIDLITSVVMEPDPKTYRLVENGEGVFETADRAEMVRQVQLLMAHRVLAGKAALRINQGRARRYSAASLLLAGGCGFGVGALSLLAVLTI